MAVLRFSGNPIIKTQDVKPSRNDFEVIGAFNAGITKYNNEIIMLLRVAERPISKHPDLISSAMYDPAKKTIVVKNFPKNDPENDFSDPRFVCRDRKRYLTSISHLRVCRSTDGIKFDTGQGPIIQAENKYEAFGLEDPRISLIENKYYIPYVSVCELGVTTSLMVTDDFNTFQRLGIIFCPENKDVVIFPAKIKGSYYALHRPFSNLFDRREIWIAESTDLINWGNHRHLVGTEKNSWDSNKIGAGATPFLTDKGWIEIYHGVDNEGAYSLGAVLLDADRPWQVKAKSVKAIMTPETGYEKSGFFGNTIFTCGLIYEKTAIKLYYGAADSSMAYAQLELDDIFQSF